MKRIHVVMGSTLLLLAMMLGGARAAQAYSIHSGDSVTLTSSKQIQDTVYAAGKTVDINSEVFGDVFCAGQNVTVSGTIHGDVICAGQSVNISGTVDGDVRLAGQSVTMNAVVSGNATIAGQSFTLQSKGSVGGDLTIGSSDAVLNGKVARDVVAGGSKIIIGSEVGRNIKAGAEAMTLTKDARVGGNISLTSKRDATKDSGAVVAGRITRTNPPEQSKPKHDAIFGFSIIWFLYCLLAMLTTTLALALLFPRLLQSITNKAMPRPWNALLTGVIASFAAPVIIATLAATIIGIPLAILAGLAWLVVLFLSGPVFAYYIGRLIFKTPRHALLTMLVGAGILIILYFIPIVGGIAILAAIWFGTGMLLLDVFKRTPRPAYTIEKP